MNILAVRSIPLNRDTFDAWKSTGNVKFARRRRNAQIPAPLAVRYEAILNLGNVRLNVDADVRIYNSPDTIRAVTVPTALRDTLGDYDLLPELEFDGAHWHKRPGFGGRGKTFHEDIDPRICGNMPGDVQRHVEGVEYRIITVGDKVVQATRKDTVNEGWPPIPTGFEWVWVGVEGIRRGGFIPFIKQAIQHIPDGEHSVLGFDVIHDGNKPWIIEVNTCPGVNQATAQRVVDAIERML